MTSAVGNRKYVVAIDLGGSGPKVGLVSDRGEILQSARRSTTTHFLDNGGAEQDPNQWWDAIRDCVREVVGRCSVPTDDIVAVSCSSQWSVTVPVDADGRALMNAIYWMDTRGARHTRRIMDGFVKVKGYGLRKLIRWLRLTGGVPTPTGADSLAHILFIKHERPEIYARTCKFLEPMDYINLRLTGRFAASHATIFPYMLADVRDNRQVCYDDRLLAWAGLDRDKLPDLLPVDAVLGPLRPEMAVELGLGTHTQVVMGSPDAQSATLGAGTVADFNGYFYVGTTAWLTCHVPFKKTDIGRFLSTMPAGIVGRNLVVAEQGAAGKCLDVFANQWLYPDRDGSGRPADLHGELEALAAGVPAGSEGLIFLPWLGGVGAPVGDGDARGGFLNQSLRSTRAHAVRAVFEGISYNLRWLMENVEAFIGRRFDTLNFIGGGAQSRLWCQIQADVMNRPIRQVAEPRLATVRGAAFLALLALGHIRLDEVSSMVRIAETFEPNPRNRDVYDAMFAEFVNSYKCNKRIFSRLNRGQTR